MVLFLLLSGKRPFRSKVLNLIRSTFLDRILTTPLPPPSLPFPPPLLLHTLTSCDFGEKWRGRGGGFIFIIRKDGYRSIKLFPWKKKKTPMTPKGSCLETTRFHANSLIAKEWRRTSFSMSNLTALRLVWPSSSKIFHLFLIQFNSFARCLPLYTASLLVSP